MEVDDEEHDAMDSKVSDKLRKRLLALAGRFVSATDRSIVADDIVQEAMVTLWRMERDGLQIRNADALATTVTKNICISHYRKRCIQTVPVSDDGYAGGMSAETAVMDKEMDAAKGRLLAGLTETQRCYLAMRADEGLSLDEIAARTGKPKTSIKTTLSKARRQIMEELRKEEEA